MDVLEHVLIETGGSFGLEKGKYISWNMILRWSYLYERQVWNGQVFILTGKFLYGCVGTSSHWNWRFLLG